MIPALALASCLALGQYGAGPVVVGGYGHAAVEKVIFVPVERDDPYLATLVGAGRRQQLRAEARAAADATLADQVAALTAQVAALTRALAAIDAEPDAAAPAAPPPAPIAPKPVPALPKPAPIIATPAPAVAPPAGPRAEAVAVLTRQCAKCHTGANSKGGLALFDAPGRPADVSVVDLLRVDRAVYDGTMPPDGDPLNLEDSTAIRAWLGDRSADVKALLDSLKSTPKGK